MKKTKVLNGLAIVALAFSIGMITFRLIESIVYNINGWRVIIPGPALYKWYEIFCFNVLGDFIFVGPILIFGVGLLIFDKFCLRRVKVEERNERG